MVELRNPDSVALYYAFISMYALIATVLLIFGYITILKPYLPAAFQAANDVIAKNAQSSYTSKVGLTFIENEGSVIEEKFPFITIEQRQGVEVEKGESEMVEVDAEPDLDAPVQAKTEKELKLKQSWIKFDDYITTTQAYTDSDITLTEIASKLNTSSFNLSKAIKTFSTYSNFYEYINTLRLFYFLQLLENKENNLYTIQTLGLKSGFSSSTTLSKYCKKVIGHTPNTVKKLFDEGKSLQDFKVLKA